MKGGEKHGEGIHHRRDSGGVSPVFCGSDAEGGSNRINDLRRKREKKMEMETLDTIVAEGIELSKKRTWVKKGFEGLMERINLELAKVPDMAEARIISEPISEWVESVDGYKYQRNIRVALVFENDAYIELRIHEEGTTAGAG